MIYALHMVSGDTLYVDLDVDHSDVMRSLDRHNPLVGSRDPAIPADKLIEFVILRPTQQVESISQPYQREADDTEAYVAAMRARLAAARAVDCAAQEHAAMRKYVNVIAELRRGACDKARDAYTIALGQLLSYGLIDKDTWREALDRPRYPR